MRLNPISFLKRVWSSAPASASPTFTNNSLPAVDLSTVSTGNAQQPAANLPSSPSLFAGAPGKSSNKARLIAANAYSYSPSVAPSAYTAFPAYVGLTGRPLRNIPAPTTLLFPQPVHATCSSRTPSTSTADSVDIDMTDAPEQVPTPPSSPPGKDDIPAAPEATSSASDAGTSTSSPPGKDDIPVVHEATPSAYDAGTSTSSSPGKGDIPVVHEATPSACDTGTSTPDADTTRPKLQPKRQQDRHVTPRLKCDIAAEIIMEDDDGTLPERYLGTWQGIRFHSPDYAATACNGSGLHHLVCGHFVTSDSPCGLNCCTPSFDVGPFNCPQCRDTVLTVIKKQLSDAEKAKLEAAAKAKHEPYAVSYLVECVSRRVELKANVTETVMSILRPKSYGRKCEEAESPNLRMGDIARQIADMLVYGAEKEFARENTPIPHEKRKAVEEEIELEVTSDKHTGKKRKPNPDTHHNPLPTEKRGRKRTSETQTTDAHLRPRTKKIKTTPPVQNGEASYQSPPPSAVRPLARKRHSESDNDAADANKRSRLTAAQKEDGNATAMWDEKCPEPEWVRRAKMAKAFEDLVENDEEEEL
ncbi:hypothetical protein BU26DRAFT_611103 [Trematosphaeria pertusa]|uniref:Uncharacterized protein n=1 Tax=Trematosphaeria pertusa TaxID=390896 RepID=A0A6A6HU36_9PLEO|nr:uncharacterized protein BU26DRAFT_611103 [Trematosphaeria pertusa]KAF2241268.1 hypothetical protein BU26DRAFT_611103 [Trematosphaeria pertusa]